jgi:eukaryotic-like serine/threonine-protein kinase
LRRNFGEVGFLGVLKESSKTTVGEAIVLPFLSAPRKFLAVENDIWFTEARDNAKSTPFLQTPFDESEGNLLPGGKWIAYASNESGRKEVYVADFPSGQNKRQVSVNNGSAIHWRADGKELFYVSNGELMSVAITATESTFEGGIPQKLFRLGSTTYDVAPDGQRFLVAVNVPDPNVPPITIVLNWPAVLNR